MNNEEILKLIDNLFHMFASSYRIDAKIEAENILANDIKPQILWIKIKPDGSNLPEEHIYDILMWNSYYKHSLRGYFAYENRQFYAGQVNRTTDISHYAIITSPED